MSHLKWIVCALATWYYAATGNCYGAVTFGFLTGIFSTSAAYQAEFKKLREQRDTAWRYMDELARKTPNDQP